MGVIVHASRHPVKLWMSNNDYYGQTGELWVFGSLQAASCKT
jgi:hypothetical protein